MEIRTFTSFWRVERKLYSLYDVALPMPISLTVVGVFAATGIPWFLICFLLHIPFAPPVGYLVWLAPPAALAYFGSRPIFEGKTLFQYLKSQFSFLLENKAYKIGLQPDLQKYEESIVLSGKALTRISSPLPFDTINNSTGATKSKSKTK